MQSSCAMELSEYVVDSEKRSMMKLQILVDVVAGWMEPGSLTEGIIPEASWVIYYNGAWVIIGTGAATILISPFRIKLHYVARLQFTNEADKCTNNIAEYKAILLVLHKLRTIGIQTCMLRID
jgi:hypothetical protein